MISVKNFHIITESICYPGCLETVAGKGIEGTNLFKDSS
jgi:hypothetical protein